MPKQKILTIKVYKEDDGFSSNLSTAKDVGVSIADLAMARKTINQHIINIIDNDY